MFTLIVFEYGEAQVNQWESLGPYGHSPKCMCIIPETEEILIGTWFRGIYRGDINGNSWTPSHQGILDTCSIYEVMDIQPIPEEPGRYLAGLWSWYQSPQGYLYSSYDYGYNWERVNVYPPNSNSGTMSFWVDPLDNQHWIWAGFTFAIYHTNDGGATWYYVSLADNPGVTKFYSPPGYDGVVFRLSIVGERPNPEMGGIERSDDSGYHWSGCWNGPPGMISGFITPGDITINPFNDQHLVVVCYVWPPEEYNEYRWMESFDGGINWGSRILDFPSPAPSKIAFDPMQEGVIYLGTEEQGLFKSIDNGESWFNISFNICRGRPVLFVKVDSAGTVYTSIEPVGFYRSSDGGESWEHLTENFPGGGVNFFLDRQPETDRTLATELSHLSLLQDDEWNRIDYSLPLDAGLCVMGLFDPVNPDRIYGATNYYNNGVPNLWHTDDIGVNWTAVESQPDTIDNIFYLDKIFPGDPRLIVKTSYGGLWIYDTESDLWEDITPPGAPFSYSDQPRASSLAPGLVYYGGNGFAYRSDNCGEDWISLPLPNISQHNWKLFPDPVYPDMVWASRIDVYPLLRSFDRGENWEVCSTLSFYPLNWANSITRLIDYSDVIIAGFGSPYSTFISYDSGYNWEAFAEGLNYQTTFDQMICNPDEGGIIWAATSDGVKKMEWNDVAVNIKENNSVYDFKLHSPYPNPFNPSTVISFELRDASFVSLIVYDIQGREVQLLVDGHRPMGYHEVIFDGTDLSSGMYFVRLQAGDFTQTRKMLLIK